MGGICQTQRCNLILLINSCRWLGGHCEWSCGSSGLSLPARRFASQWRTGLVSRRTTSRHAAAYVGASPELLGRPPKRVRRSRPADRCERLVVAIGRGRTGPAKPDRDEAGHAYRAASQIAADWTAPTQAAGAFENSEDDINAAAYRTNARPADHYPSVSLASWLRRVSVQDALNTSSRCHSRNSRCGRSARRAGSSMTCPALA